MSQEAHSSALQRAYDGLTDMIATDQFAAGARLRESTLSEAIGVSRTPIREALRRLATEGLVELLPNRGAIFLGYSGDDLQALTELRVRMEPYAVHLAVPRLTDDDLEELQRLVDEMNRAAVIPDLEVIGELNDQFHQLFLHRSGNRLLAGSLMSMIRPAIVRRTFHHYSPRALARSMAHHTEILEAAREGNADWAEAVMRAHILAGRSTVLGFADT
jgi:DNA-binding GntR family transcriptional regulator